MLNAFIDRCCPAINLLIALALAVMVVMVFGNVVLRYAFNSGIAISEEVSRWLFVWITFLGAIVAVRERGHLGTDFLLARLPPLGQRICLAISYALMIWCTWLLFSGALAQARINWDVDAPVTGASMAIFYASGVVFSVAARVGADARQRAAAHRRIGGAGRRGQPAATRGPRAHGLTPVSPTPQ